MADLYLGIDTSNYKTSVAVTDSSNNTVFAASEYLEVPAGQRGLRQSDAFFRHSCRLPDLIGELSRSVTVSDIRAVGVSTRPRRVEGSYMPCFLSGVNAALEICSVLGIPVYRFSHQEGHAAAIIENQIVTQADAILFHLSGGTTEFLRCRMDDQGYDLEIVGSTLDISIGQLIDRAGVALGMPFPAGQYMDEAAVSYTGRMPGILPKIRIKDGYFNLSGIETKLLRYISEHSEEDDIPAVIRELFDAVGRLLITSAVSLSSEYGADTVYMAGGVASSSYIRKMAADHAERNGGPDIVFGDPALSGDNAVGTARLARRMHNENCNSNSGK